MAGFFRGQGRRIARLLALLPVFLVAALSAAKAQLYDQPTLIIDPGMHMARINAVSVDAAGRLAVTGSDDKTVRVWSLADGKLLQTIRMPAGPSNIGKIYAVAMSPDGKLVAAGGWTAWTTDRKEEFIYLFDARTGKMTKRISGLPASTHSLAFSPDGRYLAAGLGVKYGLRVFDRDRQWAEAFRDTNPSGSPSPPTALSWRWAMMVSRTWTSWTDIRSPRCRDQMWTAWEMATWQKSCGRRTARPSTQARHMTMDVAAPSSPGPMPVAASGALCRPGAIPSLDSPRCRTAVSWLRRRIHS
jgi:hypothetical protein